MDMDYIKRFLGLKEGFRKHGYIPKVRGNILGQSGVTIGKGVDLGQQTESGLLAMGVPASIVGVLRPYLGLRREAADAKLKALPLILSQDAAEALSEAVSNAYIQATQCRFNKLVSEKSACPYRLEDRPKQVQAVVVSLEYQLGPRGAARFIIPIAKGDYAQAVALLRAEKNYVARRRSEANLLEEAI